MESMHEIIPFAKEMLNQKPSRGMLKVYLIGSVFAVLGTVIGLVEIVCHAFSSGEPLDADMVLLMAREHTTREAEKRLINEESDEVEAPCAITAEEVTVAKTQGQIHRSLANRLHAS